MPFLSNACKRRLVTALQDIEKQKIVLKFTTEETALHLQLVEVNNKLTTEYLNTELPTNTYDKEQRTLFASTIACENLLNKYKK